MVNHKKEIFDLLNGFFDKIYVISLKRSTDRHALMKELLHGLNYEIFWGVDGSTLNIDQLEKSGLYKSVLAKQVKKLLKTEPKDVNIAHIGCALSHIGIYQMSIEENYRKVLILEDDIAINYGSAGVLNAALSELPPGWELLYLGYLYNNNSMSISSYLRLWFAYPVLSALGYKRFDPHRFRCKFPRTFSAHLNRSGYHYGTHAYGITARGAKKILDFHLPVHREADNAVAHMCMHELINAFNITERVFHQNRKQFSSTIRESEGVK